MDPSCAKLKKTADLATLPDNAAAFAGISGKKLGVNDLAGLFQSGSTALKTNGLDRTSVPNDNPTVPGDQGFAYMVALTITENVWKDLMGQKLTIANYYPRNPDQRDTLWSLTEGTFISSGWSLKDLIARVMTSPYFNRRAPDTGGGSTAYRLAMIFDPWVAHDPRTPDPTPDPKQHNNGQGELVHRYSPYSLLHSVAAALDWAEPERFPYKAYPTKELIRAIGQYVSDYQPGTQGVDLQGLLNWEDRLGTCQKQDPMATDWIDRLVGAIPAFDAAHPGAPLTLADLTATTKDWLIGDGTISATKPDPANSEEAGLAALFGTTLNTTASSVPVIELLPKLRQLCGILLESPKFMLAGIETNTDLNAPRLRVCNGAPCTYMEMCLVYAATLSDMGQHVICEDHSVFTPPNLVVVLEQICPYGDCIPIVLDPGSIYEHVPDFGVVAYPAQLPVATKPWFDARRPMLFVARAEGARVTVASGVTFRAAGTQEFVPLKEGAALKAGDVLRIPAGAVFAARTDTAAFATPKEGMAAKSIIGQPAIDREFLEAAESSKLVTVDALLAKGAAINARDRYGQTALMQAASAGDLDLMKLLLDRGADPSARTDGGLTAADFAALANRAPASALLARRNVFPHATAAMAKSAARAEEPWLFYVASTKPLPTPREVAGHMTPADAWAFTVAGKLGTKPMDIAAAEAALRKPGYPVRGEAGRLLNAEAAARAWQDYVASGAFAREHPKLPLPAAAKLKP
jgi:hypothetical protein